MTGFSELQRAAIRRAARAGDDWIRSISAGDRVTFASLERRGIFERQAWRGDGISRDSAFEYRLSPRLRRELDRKRGQARELVVICAKNPTMPHEGRERDLTPKKSKPGPDGGDMSTKVSARHYRIARRIAKRERRSIKTTIELALERLDTEGSTS